MAKPPGRLWRLSTVKYAATALDGEGARRVGGRWNSPGRRSVYLSEHLSLAALEVLVHFTKATAPDHLAIALDVPDDIAVYELPLSALPADWRAEEAPPSTQHLGDAWLQRAAEPLMRVPSVIVPEESNFVLNPSHPDAARIKSLAPVRFTFDPRLLKT
ncbi:RES family NAD+ phosphorylase [Stigmatella sp. ncwal1]|uniref:RES family NAD+ phosphorylase n=1 Tax=Stigmatella ashevillensis TaxID=2995309 RepID=A0ABT5DD50_9BACT|nr:RES family NAD+ phosphorylase [Stigmatella ashevillena]MDC0711615.1 RES family NAD+ phosphorylase [Stigmatella ashevillena]